jgi:UDP-N-acetylmuramoylalanine-D-glutamate ligase
MPKLKVLVCGGRGYDDRARLYRLLDFNREKITCIVHGGASGADALAHWWANEREVPVEVYEADWKKHGRSAGPKRNIQMLQTAKPDLVVAFPGGPGTAHMVKIARAAKVRVIEVPVSR